MLKSVFIPAKTQSFQNFVSSIHQNINLTVVPATINQRAILEALPRLTGQPLESFTIFALNGGRFFHFNAPHVTPLLDNQIHFHLIFVVTVTEAHRFIQPIGAPIPLLSTQLIPNPSPTAMQVQNTTLNQSTKMLLECIAAGRCQLDGLADRDPAGLPGELHDLQL